MGAMAISCGSSKTPTSCTGGPYNVVGNWKITVSSPGNPTVTGYGAIDSAGLALFFDNIAPASTGDTLELPIMTGACAFSGNITSYAEPGGPNNGTEVVDSVQGNVTSAPSITGNFSGTSSGSISASPFTPLSGSVSAVSGAKTGVIQGSFNGVGVTLSLTLAPSGSNNSMSFASTNMAGCAANGTFTEVGSSNVFDVSITLIPMCPITGTFTGIGFESSSDYFSLNGGNADTYLYADILNSVSPTDSFVMEIY